MTLPVGDDKKDAQLIGMARSGPRWEVLRSRFCLARDEQDFRTSIVSRRSQNGIGDFMLFACPRGDEHGGDEAMARCGQVPRVHPVK